MGVTGQFFQERLHIFRMGADAVHARINRHHDFHCFTGAFGNIFKSVKVYRIVHRKGEVIFYTHEHVFRKGKAQYINGAGKSGFPELRALFYPGYCSCRISFFHCNAECFHSAMTIGIGFNHGQYIHFLGQVLANDSQIVAKCIQIDFHVRNRHNKISLQ